MKEKQQDLLNRLSKCCHETDEKTWHLILKRTLPQKTIPKKRKKKATLECTLSLKDRDVGGGRY